MKALKALFLSNIINRKSKNLFNEQYPDLGSTSKRLFLNVGEGTFTLSTDCPLSGTTSASLFFAGGKKTSGFTTATNGVWINNPKTFSSIDGFVTIAYRMNSYEPYDLNDYHTMLEAGTEVTEYEPYGDLPLDFLSFYLLLKGVTL